jgi:hypothetical protein
MSHEAGKGDAMRPTNHEAFSAGHDRIFGKKAETSELCYSLDNEEFNYSEIGEVIDMMDDPKVDDTYYEADCVRLTPTDGINSYTVDSILENMDERIYDQVGECYDNQCSDVSDEAKAELLAMLEAWAKKHIDLSNYWQIVGKTRECKLTAEDLE